MGVDVHRGTDVRVPQQFLHVLGRGSVRQEIAREGVTKHMEVEVRQTLYLLLCLAAHDAHRRWRLYRPVRPETDEGNLLVPLRRILRPRQGVDLIIDTVFLPGLSIVVEAVELAIAQAVLALFPLGRFEDRRQRVAEIHSTDFLPLGGPDLRLVSRPVVADAPPHRQILLVQVDVLPGEGADLANPKPCVVGNLDGQQGRIVLLFQKRKGNSMIYENLTSKNVDKYIQYLKKALSIEPDLMVAECVDELGIIERLNDPFYQNTPSILAIDEGKVVGRIEYHFYGCLQDGHRMAYVDWVYVLPEYRHNGIAQQLFKEFENECIKHNIDQYYLIRATNPDADNFYHSFEDVHLDDEPMLRKMFGER